MRLSRLVAVAGYLAAVPVTIGVAYVGHTAGFYPYIAVPVVFGVVFAVALVVLFVVLAKLRSIEGDHAPRRNL